VTKINLLPPEIAEKQKAQQRLTYFSGGLVAVSLLLLFVYLILIGQVYQENRLLQRLREDNHKLEESIAKYKDYDKQQNELHQREKTLAQIKEKEILWSHILNEVSLVIPNDVWLNLFTGDVADNDILISGYSFDHPAVAKWMIRQKEINKLQDIELIFSEKTEISDQKVVKFQTSAQLTGIEPTAGPDAAGQNSQNNQAKGK
jgi:Tfp pilus assembly protein PilN